MKRSKPNTLPFGSLSSGTMRAEDLIPTFASELDSLRLSRGHRKLVREALAYDPDTCEPENADELLDALFEALDCYCPPYAYFGAHPGDGADYGVWVSDSLEDEFDGLVVSDTSEVPKGYTGEVLHVNDHGNMTLYSYSRGRSREVWSLV